MCSDGNVHAILKMNLDGVKKEKNGRGGTPHVVRYKVTSLDRWQLFSARWPLNGWILRFYQGIFDDC